MEYIISLIKKIISILLGIKFKGNAPNLILNIVQELIPEGNQNRPGIHINPSKITIHNTGNNDSGTDARMHSNLVRGPIWSTPWHYTVDDTLIIKQLPLNEKAIHTGPGNSNSIGIEICMHPENNQSLANGNSGPK